MKNHPIVAIVGRANVGKSSLYNAVLGSRQAIVAQEAGTTRDALWARAEHAGSGFWIVDTAGMKTPEDDFELTIQEQIAEATASADIIWVVIEAPNMISQQDRRVAKLALKSKKPVYLIANKSDKARKSSPFDYKALGIKDIFMTSTTQGTGIDELLDKTTADMPRAKHKPSGKQINLALVGRPNVGKSSLFNALGKKQQAIVADKAGTTRDVNRIDVAYKDVRINLLDTAGIRRSGKIGQGIERFSVLRALAAIEHSDICLLLLDVNELNTQLDQKIAGMVKEAGKGLVIVVSKWDDVDGKTPYTRDHIAASIKNEFIFVPWAPLIFTSAESGQNVVKLFELALDIKRNRSLQIKTSELNRWLQATIRRHTPAGLKNTTPKLNYIVQENDSPSPNFKVYGKETRLLHWSYKRFMERELRENYNFEGTPIRFWFFDKAPRVADSKTSDIAG